MVKFYTSFHYKDNFVKLSILGSLKDKVANGIFYSMTVQDADEDFNYIYKKIG